MSRKSLFLSIFFLLLGFGNLQADQGKNSFHLWVGPRFFDNKSLATGDAFSSPGFPEIGFRTSFLRSSFLLEPNLGMSIFRKKSKTSLLSDTETRKSNLLLFQFSFGLKQSFWSTAFFPLAPYIELMGTYHLMLADQKYTNSSSSQTTETEFNGGELGAKIGGGAVFSFSAINQALETELENVWDIKDYGIDLHGYYYPGGILRTGSMKSLSSLKSYALGGGLYVRW